MTSKPSLSDGIPLNEPQTPTYMLWDLASNNAIGEGTALEIARQLLELHDPDVVILDAFPAKREAQGIPLIPDGEALRRLDNALYHLDSWVKHHAKCTVITEGKNEATGGGYRWTPGDRCSCGLQRAEADLSQTRASLAATPPASGGIPLIDVELLDAGPNAYPDDFPVEEGYEQQQQRLRREEEDRL